VGYHGCEARSHAAEGVRQVVVFPLREDVAATKFARRISRGGSI
jgi:hypothetical protein